MVSEFMNTSAAAADRENTSIIHCSLYVFVQKINKNTCKIQEQCIKCSSFIFRRNIVYQPGKYNSSFVGATVSFGLDNFTFDNNLYWIDGDEATALGLLWNTTASHQWVQGSDFSTWSSGTSRKDCGSIVAAV